MSYENFRRQYLEGKTSCVEAVQACLNAIESTRQYNIYVQVFADEAMQAARALDALPKEQLKPLAGCILALKDNLAYKDHSVSASSKMLEGYTSLYTATAVQRLLDAGAIVIGTTGCDEFAMGSSNESSYYGPVYNPLDPTRVPGGSSGGSAAAVAAKTCHAALGSDTGGSIRQPAAFCGIVGVKPTYGRISRYGLIAFGSSLDQIGPMTQTVADARLLLATMAGADPLDSTSADRPVPQAGEAKKGPYKIGVLKETLTSKGIDPRLKSQMEARIAQLRQAGHTVDLVDFPYLDYVVPTYYILATAEASSNLARFDGVRYGYRSPNAKSLEEVYLKSRSEGFGPEVQRRIMLGTFVLSSGYLDAYYTKAQKVRRLLANYTQSMLAQYDALLSPTTPTAAFALDSSHQRDPISLYLSDIYTVHANLTGNPAVSVPHGTDENGLPYGVQLMGGNWQESTILHMAETLFIPL